MRALMDALAREGQQDLNKLQGATRPGCHSARRITAGTPVIATAWTSARPSVERPRLVGAYTAFDGHLWVRRTDRAHAVCGRAQAIFLWRAGRERGMEQRFS